MDPHSILQGQGCLRIVSLQPEQAGVSDLKRTLLAAFPTDRFRAGNVWLFESLSGGKAHLGFLPSSHHWYPLSHSSMHGVAREHPVLVLSSTLRNTMLPTDTSHCLSGKIIYGSTSVELLLYCRPHRNLMQLRVAYMQCQNDI